MKVGVLTFHDVINAGAFLQAYASITLLRRLGHTPEIIDYTTPLHRYSPSEHLRQMGWRALIRPRQWSDTRATHAAFAKCRASHFPMSKRYETRHDISKDHYDAVVVGSDIVWDFRLHHLGNDPVYFGAGLNTPRLTAFAASCGTVRPEDPIPDYVRQGLSSFDSISVRDRNTQSMVIHAGYPEPTMVGDPTFAFADEPKPTTNRTDEILAYIIPGICTRPFIESVLEFSRRAQLPIRAVVYRVPWAHTNDVLCTPFEWWTRIANARYFVTNTFHGTIFAAIQRARFAVEMNDNIRFKIERLVTEGGLWGHVFAPGAALEKILCAETDWATTTAWMTEQAAIGRRFIESALA